jgi:hypothetical protein
MIEIVLAVSPRLPESLRVRFADVEWLTKPVDRCVDGRVSSDCGSIVSFQGKIKGSSVSRLTNSCVAQYRDAHYPKVGFQRLR